MDRKPLTQDKHHQKQLGKTDHQVQRQQVHEDSPPENLVPKSQPHKHPLDSETYFQPNDRIVGQIETNAERRNSQQTEPVNMVMRVQKSDVTKMADSQQRAVNRRNSDQLSSRVIDEDSKLDSFTPKHTDIDDRTN